MRLKIGNWKSKIVGGVLVCCVLVGVALAALNTNDDGKGELFLEKIDFTAPYLVLFNEYGYVYDKTAGEDAGKPGYRTLGLYSAVTYANCDIRPEDWAGIGIWALKIPADCPPGRYIGLIRDAADGAETAADAVQKCIEIEWTGVSQSMGEIKTVHPSY